MMQLVNVMECAHNTAFPVWKLRMRVLLKSENQHTLNAAVFVLTLYLSWSNSFTLLCAYCQSLARVAWQIVLLDQIMFACFDDIRPISTA